MPALIFFLLWIGSESWLLARLIEWIGARYVIVYLLLSAIAGVMLIRRQGMRVVRELRMATGRGELPALALIEGLVVLVAGLLLILPGVISDLVALSLLLFGLRKRLAQRLFDGIARARPDLKQPVTLEGEFRRKG